MPTYQYRCTECAHELEAVQKFTDDALTVCPECQGQLRKVYNAVGVVFKGSGFYATDNRPGKRSAPASSESKPAATKAASSESSSSSSSTASTSAA